MISSMFFSFTTTPTPYIYTLSLHDALPILLSATAVASIGVGLLCFVNLLVWLRWHVCGDMTVVVGREAATFFFDPSSPWTDRKSTRLNSSHMSISYAVFCLKKKKINM